MLTPVNIYSETGGTYCNYAPGEGLEFNTMIVASADKGIIPHSKAITGSDSVTANEGIIAEKALLYVAVTRARKNVFITGYGEMSQWLDLHTFPQPTS